MIRQRPTQRNPDLMRVPPVVAVLGAVVLLHLPGQGTAQLSEIRGRVMDRESGVSVADARVTLDGDDVHRTLVTDAQGLFAVDDLPGGDYRVTVTHVAYGEHTETMVLEADASVALRVLVGARAIELDPLVVEVLSREERAQRARATMRQEVTREEIEVAARTSNHLGDILRQTVPGLRVYDTALPGARTCVEFRGRRSVRFGAQCQSPLVILDGVRMYDPPSLYSTLAPSSIERIEVIPPAEAGLFYGSDSAFGVITIETKVWLDREEREALPPHLRGGVYDWSLELEDHSWKRVFLTALVGNALGLAAGYALADRCVEFDKLSRDIFASRCGGLETTGSWVAAMSLPLAGSALGARHFGATSVSRGKFLPAFAAGAAAMLPGYALMSAAQDRRGSATFRAGEVFAVIGIPLAVTLADHLFRGYRRR